MRKQRGQGEGGPRFEFFTDDTRKYRQDTRQGKRVKRSTADLRDLQYRTR